MKENADVSQVWCPEKDCWMQEKVCNQCANSMLCPEYAKLTGQERGGRAKELDAEVERLKALVFDNYFSLGRALKEINERMYYKELGFNSLDEYAEVRHGFHYRKAAYLIAIVANCEAAGLGKEDVRGITWSQMKELPELNEDNRSEWLKKAAELSVEDLKAEVKKSKGEEPKEKKVFITFALSEQQKELVDKSLSLAEKLTDSTVKSYHLQVLAEEFIATYGVDEASAERFNQKHG